MFLTRYLTDTAARITEFASVRDRDARRSSSTATRVSWSSAGRTTA